LFMPSPSPIDPPWAPGRYGFQAECVEKYDEITFGMFVEVFSYLPMFTIVNEAVMVVHGGLFHTEDTLLSELNAIDRVGFSLKDLPDGGEKWEPVPRRQREQYLKQLARDALWSDPRADDGYDINHRGAGVLFGPDRTRSFLTTNNLKMVVRSHECVRTGFDHPYKGSEEVRCPAYIFMRPCCFGQSIACVCARLVCVVCC